MIRAVRVRYTLIETCLYMWPPLSQLCSLPSVTVALHSSTDYNMWWVKAVFILFSTVVADFDADLLKLSEEFDSPGNVHQPVFIVNIAKYLFQI